MTYGPISRQERARRGTAERRRKQKARDAYLDDIRAFLVWLRESPRAFVVFNKADIKSLRK